MDTISGNVAGHRTEDPNYYVEYFPLSCRPTHHTITVLTRSITCQPGSHCARSRRVTTTVQPSPVCGPRLLERQTNPHFPTMVWFSSH